LRAEVRLVVLGWPMDRRLRWGSTEVWLGRGGAGPRWGWAMRMGR
jgi:hypothetical protein